MMDCKSMPTPMVMNLKKMNKASFDSGKIDPHLYRHLIGSLMYLVNTRPLCYAVSILNQFMSHSRQNHWIAAKHVLRYLRGTVGLWPEICLRCRHEIAGIFRCRLGRERSGLEEHIRLLFYLGICHGFLVQ
jgi:hypothetical protein